MRADHSEGVPVGDGTYVTDADEPWTSGEILEAAEMTVVISTRKVYRKYRDWIEFDDVAQELRLWVFQNLPKAEQFLRRTDPVEQRKGWAALTTTLTRVGERYARREKAVRTGYRVEDEWFASRAIVQELLPVVFAGGDDPWATPPDEHSGVKAPSNPAEGNNRITTLAEIGRAVAAMPAEDDALLRSVYYLDTHRSRMDIAKREGIALSTLQRRERRALDRLVAFLGGPSPWEHGQRRHHDE